MSKSPPDTAQEPTPAPPQRSSEAEPVEREVSSVQAGRPDGGERGANDDVDAISAAPQNPELGTAIHALAAAIATDREPGKKSGIQRLAERLGNVRSLTISGLLILLVVSLAGAATWEFYFQNTVLIEPIRVPKELSEKGYTREVIAQRLMDELVVIRNESTTAKERRAVAAEWAQADIEVPGAGLSLKSVIRYVKAFAGFPDTRFGGEITRQDELLHLRLRMSGGRTAVLDPPPRSEGELDELLRLGAHEMMKLIDPYVLAAYFYYRDKQASLDMIAYCLANKPDADDAWAYNLWGFILHDDGNYNEAIDKYKSATREKPNFAIAYNNWGRALEALGDNDGAIEKYRKTIQLYPEYAIAYNNWGIALGGQGNHAGAIEKYRKAIEFDPKYALPYNNWGVALNAQNDYAGAIEKYGKAIEFDPKNALAYNNWGRALEALGDNDGATEKYRKAAELDPGRFKIPR